MGVLRSLKRFIRTWKALVYLIGVFLIIQIFVSLNSSTKQLEIEELKRMRQEELLRNHKAANDLLQGENPLIRRDNDNGKPNPKDPKLRNQFLEHIGNNAAAGVLEDKNINVLPVIENPNQVNRFEKKPDIDDKFEFQPVCEVKLKDAQSAVNRAKSAHCKQEISDIACKMQENDLFPESMPRTCPHESKFVAQAPLPSSFDDTLPRVRICFMLVVHGRSFRQLRRLLRVIYHRDHYFYIHVDERSNYLLRETLKATQHLPNVKIAPWRMATIWGGASLLQMLLRAINDVLALWSDWDFFINLSGLDFPIESDENLIQFLSTYRDKNFMKSHGRDDDKFIRKQGLDRVFVECDQHMWRLGKRELPKGINVNGGSDWIALNREFCNFVTFGKDKLLEDLKYWYRYTLLPAESFFHTLIQNSGMCEKFVDNNLRVTNWNRARGCKCQYKHIVDWCGCSPNDFYPSDLVRLHTTRPVFFARKFEEIINQEVVNHLDFKLYGKYPSHVPGLTSYWENCYDHVDGPKSLSDASLTYYTSFARLGLVELSKQPGYREHSGECALHLIKIYEVEVYKRSEQFAGYLVTAGASWGDQDGNVDSQYKEPDVKIQALISHQASFRILDDSTKLAARIETASVGTQWDVKELVLRDWGGIIGPYSDPRLISRWRKSDTDFVVTIVVIDPFNVVTDYSDFKTPSKSAGVTDTPLSIRKPMRPGRWTVRFYLQRQFSKVVAEVDFYVVPLQFKQAIEGDASLSKDNRGVEDDRQVNGASRNLYSIRTTLSLKKDDEAFQEVLSNSLHVIGDRLKSWIDAIVSRAWLVKDVCFASKDVAEWKESKPEKCRRQRNALPNLCANMNWSSFSPDPKSELGPVKANGRIR